MSGYVILICIEKMSTLSANSGYLDQTPHSAAASDLGLDCLLVTRFGVSRLHWVNGYFPGHLHNYVCIY